MTTYIGVTIGPVFKTLREANTPVGLWFGSLFFSEFAKTICATMTETFGESLAIFSPYYEGNEGRLINRDGIGKYHDRLLCYVIDFEEDKLQMAIAEAKETMVAYLISRDFPHQKKDLLEFLNHYLQVNYVIIEEEELEEKNIIKVLNNSLDRLELMAQPLVSSSENLFKQLFKSNHYLKDSQLVKHLETGNFLFEPNQRALKSIEDIAGNSNYYAILYSDGDKVGRNLLKVCESARTPLEQAKKVADFSKACLGYAEQAVEAIKEYGGMPIYAGGDDLLFLAPISNDASRLFELCQALNAILREVFQNFNQDGDISVSFGVSVHYKKFPLYEALEQAQSLLYQAKREGGSRVALSVTKHSGQSVDMIISIKEFHQFGQLLDRMIVEESLESLGQKIREFSPLLELMFEEETHYDSFMDKILNLFDNSSQQVYHDYVKKLFKYYYDYHYQAISSDFTKSHTHFLIDLLWILKFWKERE